MANQGLTERFKKNPTAVFIEVIKQAGAPMSATAIQQRLTAHGLPSAAVGTAWTKAQRDIIRYHPRIRRPTTTKYEWAEQPLPPAAAAERLLELIRTKNQARNELIKGLVDALGQPAESPDDAVKPVVRGDGDERKIRQAIERQLKIDGLRLLAELAAEMEFVAYNAGDPDIMLQRVQLAVAKAGLTTNGAPGQDTGYEPDIHQPIGEAPTTGSLVTIVRPGYSWRASDEVVVLQRAQVMLS